MKFAFAILLVALCCAANFAQETNAEKDFEKNKLKYKLEKFSEGEDASSGYDYLVYKNKDKIVKIREIWSSSAETTYRVEDYYFKDGKLILFAEYTFAKRFYKTAVKGTNITLTLVEKLSFTDSKLSNWLEKGKSVANDDKRWQDKEMEVLEKTSDQLENYKLLKAERN